MLRGRHQLGWRGLPLVLCFRNLPSMGQVRLIRIEAPNALDRIQFDIDDNRYVGFSDDETLRSQPMWDCS